MKKTLYSTTALAAAGLLTLGASDAFAQAAAPAAPEKLKMSIGGFFTSLVGYASNSTRTGTGGTTDANYDTFDIKNDSEIMFKGSVALDNGMKVSLQIEFETDPSTAGGNTTNGNTTSQVALDESWLGLDTNGYGEVRIGNQKLVILTNGVSAPNAGSLNPSNGDTSNWIVRPSAGMTVASAFGQVSGADQNRINYLSPTVAGFRFAAGYTPSTTESDNMPVIGGTGSETQNYSTALQYGFNLSGMAFRTSAAYSATVGTASNSNDQYTLGADVKIGDFTIGGAFTHQWNGQEEGVNTTATTNSNNLDSWNAGILYNPGPYKVAFRTTQTYSDGARTISGQDKAMMYKIAGNYVLGPGVELTADVIHMNWQDEASVAASNNKGFAVIGGIAVTF